MLIRAYLRSVFDDSVSICNKAYDLILLLDRVEDEELSTVDFGRDKRKALNNTLLHYSEVFYEFKRVFPLSKLFR